jgi:hypothetical protein
MAVTNRIYGNVFAKAFAKEINFLTDNIAVTLHNVTYVPDQDAHIYRSSVTNELGTAAGYTAGGQNAAGKTSTYTGATNVHMFDFNDVVWTAVGTLTGRSVVVSDITPGSAATNPLLTYHLSDVDVSATDAAWTFQLAAAGLFTVTVA